MRWVLCTNTSLAALDVRLLTSRASLWFPKHKKIHNQQNPKVNLFFSLTEQNSRHLPQPCTGTRWKKKHTTSTEQLLLLLVTVSPQKKSLQIIHKIRSTSLTSQLIMTDPLQTDDSALVTTRLRGCSKK